jgi:hypothetical protein
MVSVRESGPCTESRRPACSRCPGGVRLYYRVYVRSMTRSTGCLRASNWSASATGICRYFALLAQLVEHFHGKEGVAGSSPAEGFASRATARFSRFRSGLGDPFRAEGKGRRFRAPQMLSLKALLVATFRGSTSGPIARSWLSRVPSGHRSVADDLPRLPDHLNYGAAAGGRGRRSCLRFGQIGQGGA